METTPLQNQEDKLFDIVNSFEQFDKFISKNRSIVIFSASSSIVSSNYISQLRQDKDLEKYLVQNRIGVLVVDVDKRQGLAEKEKIRMTPSTIGYSDSRRIGIKLGPMTISRFTEDCLANWYGIPPQKT